MTLGIKFYGNQFNVLGAPHTVDELLFTERWYKKLRYVLLLFAEPLDIDIYCGKNKT